MKKFLLFASFVLCLGIAQSVAEKTVYFANTGSWDKVYAYYWNADGQKSAWPGEEISKNEFGLYSVTVDDAFENIIFNGVFNSGGGDQTHDLVIEDNAIYNLEGKQSTYELTAVYLDNSLSNWDKVCIHCWGTGFATEWPGVEITKNEDGLYSASIPTYCTGFLFDNGDTANTSKTFDLNKFGITYYNDGYPYVYMLGSIKLFDENEEHVWNPEWDGAKLEYQGDGVYTISRVEIIPQETGVSYGKFRFISKLNKDWENVNNFVPANDGEEITVGMNSSVKNDGNTSDGGWTIHTSRISAESHYDTYDFKLDLANNTLAIESSTGIEKVEFDNDNAAAEYFNLQGVKVNNPTQGLYIVRQGAKTYKQLVK